MLSYNGRSYAFGDCLGINLLSILFTITSIDISSISLLIVLLFIEMFLQKKKKERIK